MSSRPASWRLIRAAVVALVAAYLAACAFLYSRQAHFIFFPEQAIASTPADFGCMMEEVSIQQQPHGLNGWWLPGPSGQSAMQAHTVIYFHGNGGNIGANAEHACRLQKMGYAVLLFDYRGYGKSEGEFPSEQSVYSDAERAWQYVRGRGVSPAHVILYGHSLGGAVAIEMATRHPGAGALIAESTFTSLLDMAKLDTKMRVFPLSRLLNQHMTSIEKVSSLKMPVLFIHGERDNLVPAYMSERLFAAAAEPKSLMLVPGAGHENCAATAGKQYAEAVSKLVEVMDRPRARVTPISASSE